MPDQPSKKDLEDDARLSLIRAGIKPLALTDPFTKTMGLFYGLWASLELTTDYAIYKFLNVTPAQAHLITSGMMFGRKARLLADLIGRSDHPNKAKILGAFNKVRGNSKRDVFAHSYLRSTMDSVTFVERSTSGEYRAREHTFTLEEFAQHVHSFATACTAFSNSLDVPRSEVEAFAKASLSLDRKSKTSPDQPNSSE